MRSYDMVVVGSGPAGQKAAVQASKLSKRVAIIEKARQLGGASLNTGTLPSKTLKDTIEYLHGLSRRGLAQLGAALTRQLTLPDLMTRKDQVIETEVGVITHQLQRNHIDILPGTAAFLDPHTLSVTRSDGQIEQVQASAIVLATGSRPRRPSDIPFDDLIICDSDSFLRTTMNPTSIIVLGGGVIGTEYASMLAAFGINVTLIDRRTQMLRFLDLEIAQALEAQMRQNGVTMRLRHDCSNVTVNEAGRPSVHLENGETLTADMLLYTMGRIGNTEALNLGAIGLATDQQGQLSVNAHYQTLIPHIYATGDVIGFPALAATAMEQGRLAACHAFQLPATHRPKVIPYGIYSIPEVSMVGLTEEELTTAHVPHATGRAFFREMARGHISGDLHGLLKVIFHRETHALLGVHIIGAGATELIHIGQSVLTYGGAIEYFIHNVFNYPTMAECYRTAALDGLNRLHHPHSQ
ncbi:MAG: NAD(P)(+) transhydrogenase [Nitrospira sp. HN-bin3]|uniref:Si-specific NAD(P)(+) transhydrogenase n=1 Tax=Nitrospira cf. moscoviensis SBR1015 TaxID=96242 RepID=UPI000A0D4410|nr:Si-specific NAD(P)(+) transhydrogenase [Nitrospira cf. moscoviensis SBR1015]OQW51749.1 MAG: NAD(P)(+) transhydrogenase [Nitrospira sp. HN-bin3]